MMSMRKAVIVAGPTGVGKTDLARCLARRLDGELVSCDSVQVYRGLVIGANKTYFSDPHDPPQHLIDIVEPTVASFTAADFYDRCQVVLRSIWDRGRLPILVGGTGFYLDWILDGRPGAPSSDPTVMATIDDLLQTDRSWSDSLGRLRAVDPEFAQSINPNDYYRLKRALAVYTQTGRPLGSFGRQSLEETNTQVRWTCVYLTTNREYLARRIDERCERMVQDGLIEEVHALWQQGSLPRDSQAGRAIGYAETLSFLVEADETVRQLGKFEGPPAEHCFYRYLDAFQGASRRYSRKQETWFWKRPDFCWVARPVPFEPFDFDDAEDSLSSSGRPIVTSLARAIAMSDSEETSSSYRTLLADMNHHGRLVSRGNSVPWNKQMRTYRTKHVLFDQGSAALQTILQRVGRLLRPPSLRPADAAAANTAPLSVAPADPLPPPHP